MASLGKRKFEGDIDPSYAQFLNDLNKTRQDFVDLSGNQKLGHQMKIFVETLTEKTISLEVKSSYTIEELKYIIHCKEAIRIPCCDLALIFSQMVLDDSCTLADFDIEEGYTLTLVHKSKGMMQIFVKTLTERTSFSVEVKRSDTISKVKDRIHDKVGIPSDKQVLIFDKMSLEDSATLTDLHIHHESTLTLVLKWSTFMPLFVKIMAEKILFLEVKPSDTVANLKAKIEDKCTSLDKKKLVFDGKTLKESRTLAYYNIPKESTIEIVIE